MSFARRAADPASIRAMGNCRHRKYLSLLIDMVRNGTIDPAGLLTTSSPCWARSRRTRSSTAAGRAG
jgi:hypothetical protein